MADAAMRLLAPEPVLDELPGLDGGATFCFELIARFHDKHLVGDCWPFAVRTRLKTTLGKAMPRDAFVGGLL